MTTQTTVTLAAINLLNRATLCADDRSIPGVYHIEFNQPVSLDKIADAALDVFHSNVPVDQLDDFSFVVFDPDTGRVYAPADDHQDYSLSSYGRGVDLKSSSPVHHYGVTVKAQARDRSLAVLGTVNIVARSKREAGQLAKNALWDARLGDAGCRACLSVERKH